MTWTARLLAAVLGIGLLAGTAEAQTLTMATGDAIGSLRNKLGNRVRDVVAERKAGLTLRHIEGPVLGNAAQIRDQAAEGSVDLVGFDLAWLTPYSDLLKTTSFAFVFRSEAHLKSVFDSPLMKDVEEKMAKEQKLRILAVGVLPSRTFFTKKPIVTATDFGGLKIRSPQLNVWIESYKSLGANPTPVNWNEVFLALKTGVVDGGHGLPADVIANKWHLAAPHITALDDMFAAHAWFMNEPKWQSLDPAKRAFLRGVLQESIGWLAEESAKVDEDAIVTMLKEGGGTFVSSNPVKLQRIAAAVGEQRTRAFPASDLAKLRTQALAAGRKNEGTADWWGKGVIDSIETVK